MPPRLFLIALCMALPCASLAACSRPADQTATDTPVGPSEPDAPAVLNTGPTVTVLNTVDLRQPVSLTGTEPFWSVTVKSDSITLDRPGAEQKHYMPTDFVVNGNRATLQTGALTLTLAVATCSDGMSERRYPLTAEAHVGKEILRGCAMGTAEMAANKP